MGLEDALPDRPLFENELDELLKGLPEGYSLLPGSAIDFGTGALMYPTFVIEEPDGSVTLFGRSRLEEKWMKIESWSTDEFEPEKQEVATQEWGEKHLPEGGVDVSVE